MLVDLLVAASDILAEVSEKARRARERRRALEAWAALPYVTDRALREQFSQLARRAAGERSPSGRLEAMISACLGELALAQTRLVLLSRPRR